MNHRLRTATISLRALSELGRWLGALCVALGAAAPAHADFASWLSENFQVSGFYRTQVRFNSPSFEVGNELQLSALRNELNLEASLNVYSGRELNINAFAILRPTYDAVYDLYPDVFGTRARSGAFGTQLGRPLDLRLPGVSSGDIVNPANGRSRVFNPKGFREGDSVRGAGGGIDGQFRFANLDAQFLFGGEAAPCLFIDALQFLGNLCAPATPFGGRQEKLGGAPTLARFARGPAAQSPSLAGSLARAREQGRSFNRPIVAPSARENPYDRKSFDQAPFDINARELELQTECFDNAHPTCFLREAYLEFDYKNTFVRLGKQQIVFGKSDAFRLQDIVNPMDIAQRNIFDQLEDRRIPQLALDVVQGFGNVGPFEDLSLELVWNFDRFLPTQAGQCGDAQALAVACQGRVQAFSSQLFGFGASQVKEIDWSLRNTEPGFRVEGRLKNFTFSLSGYYGFQDIPIGKFTNAYSVNNPNPAALLFLQGLGVPEIVQQRANDILATSGGIDALLETPDGIALLAELANRLPADQLLEITQAGDDAGGALIRNLAPRFTQGFDPFDDMDVRTAGRELADLYNLLSGDVPIISQCAGLGVGARARCISDSQVQALILPFTLGNIRLENPRVFTLGGSFDYQLSSYDALVRAEFAYDFDRGFVSSASPDLTDESDVISAVLGLDVITFLPFLNRSRTAILTGQLFAQHIIDHKDEGFDRRFIEDETTLIGTFAMQNAWRNDSLILFSFMAYDFNAQSFAFSPTLRWILSNNLSLEFGASFLNGRKQDRQLRPLCRGGKLTNECITNPDNFNAGQFQGIFDGFEKSEGPTFQRSFADGLNEDRDELFFNFIYQF